MTITVDQMHTKNLYLNLMKESLLGFLAKDPPLVEFSGGTHKVSPGKFRNDIREAGLDWPSTALSMIGLKRMENIQFCVETVLSENIEGDLIETGVWRGGAVIFMKAILEAHGIRDRVVWVADSFEGLPMPTHPDDALFDSAVANEFLGVSLETVKKNLELYKLLDENVEFLHGWFKDTLPIAPMARLAILRLDGDLYESTMDALSHLYPKLSDGGFVIVDDYNIQPCRNAVHDYRLKHDITDNIVPIDRCGVYWRKQISSV